MARAQVEDAKPPSDLVVNEIFGPTIQGEGPHAGRRCGFLRLGGCNLSCRWCDTPYTWDWTGVTAQGPFDPKTELHRQSQATVLDTVLGLGVDLLVISGGEPLNQAGRLEQLVPVLLARGVSVDIETNGTHAPARHLADVVETFVVSPKLEHSGDPAERRIVPAALHLLASLPQAHFKFVARGVDDLDEIDQFVDQFGIQRVWIMPEGQEKSDVDRVSTAIAEAAISRGWNFSSRLHVLLWNDLRGV